MSVASPVDTVAQVLFPHRYVLALGVPVADKSAIPTESSAMQPLSIVLSGKPPTAKPPIVFADPLSTKAIIIF